MATFNSDAYYWVDRTSPAWDRAWKGLAQGIKVRGLGDGADLDQCNPVSGEGWQYMGSEHKPAHDVHTFRHRDHPKTHGREYVNAVDVSR